MHLTGAGHKTVDLSLMNRISRAWDIGYEDFTNRVLLWWLTGGDDHANRQPAIRVIGITAAIIPPQDLVGLVEPHDLAELAGSVEIRDELVALGVHIRRDMVGDLARGMAEAHPGIVGGRPQPQRAPRPIGFS